MGLRAADPELKWLWESRLRNSFTKLPGPRIARESPAGKIAIQKRQSIFDLSLARGRPAKPESKRDSGTVDGDCEAIGGVQPAIDPTCRTARSSTR
jgi:hypothetical protein